jgi:hypothetical protein
MSETILERAARALCVAQGIRATENEMARGADEVRAVLRAIYEPTEEMIEEGAYVIPIGQGAEEGPPNVKDARACWQAMIDAALGDDI